MSSDTGENVKEKLPQEQQDEQHDDANNVEKINQNINDIETAALENDGDYIRRLLSDIEPENVIVFFKYLLKKKLLLHFVNTPNFHKSLNDPDNSSKEMCHIICEFYTYGKEDEKNIAFRYLAKLMARQKLGRWAHHTQVNDYFLDIIIACIPNSR